MNVGGKTNMPNWKKITKGKYKGLQYRKKGKMIQEVRNPKGKLKPLAISQRGDYTGFTAHYKTKPYRRVAKGRDAERLAASLAKKGHKCVTFWD